jgi:D-alanyl-D-alanine carboxypeptidase/D-alanyl-D-alanine-endopeptidase (penicillin-binding protein 4)
MTGTLSLHRKGRAFLPSLATVLAAVVLFLWAVPAGSAGWTDQVRQAAGDGSVLVTDLSGRVIFAHHPDKPLVPASTLKVLTAAALSTLGPDYRFRTEFRRSTEAIFTSSGGETPIWCRKNWPPSLRN